MASSEREALRQEPAAGLLGPGLEAPEIAAALAQLSQDPDVQEIRLYSCGEACGYGSRARSEARPGSDLDLLLILKGSHTAERERQLRARTRALLLPLLPVDLDLLISDAAVPGPMPILGFGAAFGFSRRLRRRVALPHVKLIPAADA
jgi:predicted nucleotidyltransferase